jgi:hypothetical protein
MKKYWVLLLIALPFVVGSCLSDKEVVSNDYCYIWDASLGQMTREVHMLDSLGKDTIILTSYTGKNFYLTIDQHSLTIENKEPLLYGTLLRAVLVDLSYTGSGLFYRTKDDVDSTWHNYSSTDSMDLRKPVEFLLLANDNKSFRIYTLKLNVQEQEMDSLYWKKDCDAVSQLQGKVQQSAVIVQNGLAVLGKSSDAITLAKRTETGAWDEQPTNLPVEADVQTITKKGNTLYVSSTDGYLYSSVDGMSWQKADATQRPGVVLAGTSADYLYAVQDGELYRCSENEQGGLEFKPEGLDESSVNLPSLNVKSLQMKQDNGNQRLVMVGNRAIMNDKTSVVWNKMWNKDIKESEAVWMFINQTDDNKCTLPQLECLNLIQYDGKCLAFGGASVAGKGARKAMDALYVSQDFGISWRKDSEWHLPAELKGVNGPICSVVDDDNVIWIIANGEVWRGKINRLDPSQQ